MPRFKTGGFKQTTKDGKNRETKRIEVRSLSQHQIILYETFRILFDMSKSVSDPISDRS